MSKSIYVSFLNSENIREKKQTEEIRRKLEERKEKRKLEQKLLNVKTLGDVTGEDDDNAANWVERSRRIQKEKEEAQKRAKLLEEMDEVFGVGDMVSQEIKKVKDKAYTSKDLRGLKVEHDRVSTIFSLNCSQLFSYFAFKSKFNLITTY